MPIVTLHPLDDAMLEMCRNLINEVAATYDVPPIMITAHVRNHTADLARMEVQRLMLTVLHLRRWQVARIFNRDVRRVRKSVLGV